MEFVEVYGRRCSPLAALESADLESSAFNRYYGKKTKTRHLGKIYVDPGPEKEKDRPRAALERSFCPK